MQAAGGRALHQASAIGGTRLAVHRAPPPLPVLMVAA